MYPVEQWECTRAQRVEALQGNENLFVKRPCQDAGLW
ncbi:endonuclease [uncultured Bilophila sp.]|nr:endonuclease [uncultured Bilophila sp.]